MNEEEKEKFIKKLSYISKSKKSIYDNCPLAFKFSYIDKIPQPENPYFIIGTDVHEFIEAYFNDIKIEDGNLIGLNKLIFHPNIDYRKNVIKFEIKRWETVKNAGFGEDFYLPVFNEKRWTTESPKLIGIVDRVHKCFKGDPLAPKHSEFKDGDLVIVENKTGKPTFEKCKKYHNDFYWYKIIMEVMHPELAPIKWGTIYYPYDNFVYHTKLENEKCRILAKEIHVVREKIIDSIKTGIWKKTPSPKACKWCRFKYQCKMIET